VRIATCWTLLVREPIRSLRRNNVRSGLAMLGIMVGVATVMWVVSIGRAGKQAALDALDSLGENLVWIEAGSRNAAGVRTGSHGMTTLMPSDADAIRAEVPLITKVSENVDARVQVIYGDANWSTTFRGVSPDYVDVRRWELARGAIFDADAVQRATTVVVIGDTVRRQLFADQDPIGERIRINASLFTVIGVLAPKGQSATGNDQDDQILIPWTTARRRILGKNITWLDDILCSAVSTDAIPAAGDQIAALLRQRHHITPGAEDDFNIRHPEQLLQAKVKSAETLQRLLFLIASMALLVGGIGIMNVMLASVAQRTNEIGVRVAVGARPSAIRLQFLAEAVILTVLGGSLGIVLAVVAAPAIGDALGWWIDLTRFEGALAFGFSIAVGVISGYYPASRAARLDPIAALRVER
jgi:putative ABC transport system permease protein